MTIDSSEIRTEADDILRSGLLTILGRHGEVHIVAAVLDRGVRDVAGFWADLRERKGIPEPLA